MVLAGSSRRVALKGVRKHSIQQRLNLLLKHVQHFRWRSVNIRVLESLQYATPRVCWNDARAEVDNCLPQLVFDLDVRAPLAAEEEGLLAQPRAGQNQEYAAQLLQNISSRYYFFQ
jgi:hypothetical protein